MRVVGREDDGPALALLGYDFRDCPAPGFVESGGGLVEQKHRGAGLERKGELQSQAHAGGVGRGELVGGAAQTESFEEIESGIRQAPQVGGEGKVLGPREQGIQVQIGRGVPHARLRTGHGAHGGPDEAGEYFQQRRFPTPVRPEHGQHIAYAQCDVDLTKDPPGTVSLAKFGCRQHVQRSMDLDRNTQPVPTRKQTRTMRRGLITFVVCFLGVFLALQVHQRLNQPQADAARSLEAPGRLEPARLGQSVPTAPGGLDFRAAARKLVNSVVSIQTRQQAMNWMGEQQLVPAGAGSGVILRPDGYIVTNNHVVAGAEQISVQLADKRVFEAKLVGTDPRTDIAVLKIQAPNLQPASVGSSKSLEVGQWVLAAGNPLGYDNTVSVGVISSLGRTLEAGDGRGAAGTVLTDMIQTDAAINQGNSGGALANPNGELVGINTAIASIGGGSIGIGFAIPIDRVRRVTDDIIRFGRARHGTIGVGAHAASAWILNSPRGRQLMKQDTGAEPPRDGLVLRTVRPGSPAERAGMRALDVIEAINGEKMETFGDMMRVLADKAPGERVDVRFWSRGRSRTVSIVLEFDPSA